MYQKRRGGVASILGWNLMVRNDLYKATDLNTDLLYILIWKRSYIVSTGWFWIFRQNPPSINPSINTASHFLPDPDVDSKRLPTLASAGCL